MTAKLETQQTEKKHCAYCEKELHGRDGKIYCAVDCKNNFNARIRSAKRARENQVFPNTITKLKRNYRILMSYKLHELESGNQTMVDIDELRKQGFDDRFCTGVSSNYSGQLHLYCFDYAWVMEDKWVTLSYDPGLSKRR